MYEGLGNHGGSEVGTGTLPTPWGEDDNDNILNPSKVYASVIIFFFTFV